QQRVVVQYPRQYGVRHLQYVELTALGHPVGDVDVGEGDIDRGRAGDAAVGPGVEDEGVVGARGVGDLQRPSQGLAQGLSHCRVPFGSKVQVPRRGATVAKAPVSASSASPIRQAARSRGPTALETVRTSRAGTDWAAAASATPKPSMASATARGWRR